MSMTAPVRRSLPDRSPWTATTARLALLLVALVTTGTLAAVGPGHGAPPSLRAAAPGDTDDEGGTEKLRQQLDVATRGYLEAKAAVDRSTRRERELTAHLNSISAELATHSQTVGELAGVAYRTGRLGSLSALLSSGSPDDFLDRAAALSTVAASEDAQLRRLQETRAEETRARVAIGRELAEQRKQLQVMAARKQQAERALAEAAKSARAADGPGVAPSGGGSATAKPAPRNSDGSWPPESCSVNDPTTSGCITPRTLHALQQAKAAGFTRYVSCYRSGSFGEHPKGRACDFAAQRDGFGGVATGGDKTYGDNLAAYFIRNASRLGVLYVIWYKQIWLPSSGWKVYSGAGGDPSSDHTNHVHLSVY